MRVSIKHSTNQLEKPPKGLRGDNINSRQLRISTQHTAQTRRKGKAARRLMGTGERETPHKQATEY